MRKFLFVLTFSAVLVGVQAQASSALICIHAQKEAAAIKDLDAFSSAMTRGMILRPGQEDLFDLYRLSYLGDPTIGVDGKGLAEVLKVLKQHPELNKVPFREVEIQQGVRVYQTPKELSDTIRSQMSVAAQIRSNLFQIEANLGFWKQLLGYHDPAQPEGPASPNRSDKKAYKEWTQRRFKKYLSIVISSKNRQFLADPEVPTREKEKILFETLKALSDFYKSKGRPTEQIRQAMVDLVATTGFTNEKTRALLKAEDAQDRIEGLRQLKIDQDDLAMSLGYEGHFYGLLKSLKISFSTVTGLKEKETDKQIRQLEKLVQKAPYKVLASQTTRIRSLSIQESPFRSCLGGDCSTRTYFNKALDPNFYYFTITDAQNRSAGQITVVLGTAVGENGRKQKVAFVDKIQNIPDHKLTNMLKAIAMSVEERGYKLALPEVAQYDDERAYHAGISNTDSTIHFITTKLNPQLPKILKQFEPHPLEKKYGFDIKYSRAEKRLAVRIFNLKGQEEGLEFQPAAAYQTRLAPEDLSRNSLIQSFLEARNSTDPEKILKYVTSGNMIPTLENSRLYTRAKFLADLEQITENAELPFRVRKQAWYEWNKMLGESNWQKAFTSLNAWPLAERQRLFQEIRDWLESTTQEKKNFANLFYGKISTWVETDLQQHKHRSLQFYLENKLASVNGVSSTGASFFELVLKSRRAEMISFFMNHPDFDVFRVTAKGWTPLMEASAYSELSVRDQILERQIEKKPALVEAYVASYDQLSAIYHRDFLQRDLNAIYSNPKFAFKLRKHAWMAAHAGAPQLTQIFSTTSTWTQAEKDSVWNEISGIARANVRNPDPLALKLTSAIQKAAPSWMEEYIKGKHYGMVKFLVEHHLVDINGGSNDKETFFGMAVRLGDPEMILFFTDHPNFDVTRVTAQGRSPLMFASMYGTEEFQKKILKMQMAKNPDAVEAYIGSYERIRAIYDAKKFQKDMSLIYSDHKVPFKLRKKAWLATFAISPDLANFSQSLEIWSPAEKETIWSDLANAAKGDVHAESNARLIANKIKQAAPAWMFSYIGEKNLMMMKFLDERNFVDINYGLENQKSLFQAALESKDLEIIQLFLKHPQFKIDKMGSRGWSILRDVFATRLQDWNPDLFLNIVDKFSDKKPSDFRMTLSHLHDFANWKDENSYLNASYQKGMRGIAYRQTVPFQLRYNAWMYSFAVHIRGSDVLDFEGLKKNWSDEEQQELWEDMKAPRYNPGSFDAFFNHLRFRVARTAEYAIVHSSAEKMHYLLKYKLMDPNQRVYQDKLEGTPFMFAAMNENVEAMDMLVSETGVDINYDLNGKTALSKLAEMKKSKAFLILLQRPGIKIDSVSAGFLSKVIEAAKEDKDLQALVEKLAVNRKHLTYMAIKTGNKDLFDHVSDHSRPVDFHDPENGKSALKYAMECAAGYCREYTQKQNQKNILVDILSNPHTDLHVSKEDAQNLFARAIDFNLSASVIQRLLKSNPTIDINSIYGLRNTPLAEAAEAGNLEVVELLLRQPGIQINENGGEYDRNRGALAKAIRSVRNERPVAGQASHYPVIERLLREPSLQIFAADIEAAYDAIDPAILNSLLERPVQNPEEINVAVLVAQEHASNKRLAMILSIPGIRINQESKVRSWDRHATPLTVALQIYRHYFRELTHPRDEADREQAAKELEFMKERIEMLLAQPGIDINNVIKRSNWWSPLVAAIRTTDPWMVQRFLKIPGIDPLLEDDGYTALTDIERYPVEIRQLVQKAVDEANRKRRNTTSANPKTQHQRLPPVPYGG